MKCGGAMADFGHEDGGAETLLIARIIAYSPLWRSVRRHVYCKFSTYERSFQAHKNAAAVMMEKNIAALSSII